MTLCDESLGESGEPQCHFDCMASFARSEAATAWSKIVRVGDDGDTCFLGFADTTLLDFVSRGLDVRPVEEKRIGDFEPCHRIGVFTEPLHERVVQDVDVQPPLQTGEPAAAAAAAAAAVADAVAAAAAETEEGAGKGEERGGGAGTRYEEHKEEEDADAGDEGGLDIQLADMRPRWVSIVSQLDVIDLMVGRLTHHNVCNT